MTVNVAGRRPSINEKLIVLDVSFSRAFLAGMSSPDPRRPRLRPLLRWWSPVCLMATVSFVSGGNPVPLPFTIFSMDKVIHLLVFGLIATSIYRVANPHWPEGKRAFLAIGLTALFGMADELHQSFTPGRMMDFADWMADFFGAVIAVYVYRGWAFYRRCLELAIPLKGRQAVSS